MEPTALITMAYPLWQWALGLAVLLWVWEKVGKSIWLNLWRAVVK